MNSKYILYRVVLLALISLKIQAQENEPVKKKLTNHFLEIGLGINYHAIRDNGTSPLIYKGYLPTFHLQYFFTNEKFLGILEENFFMGYINTRNKLSANGSKAVSYNNELSFDALYRVKNFNSITLNAGLEFGTLTNIRVNDKFNNANLNYDFFAYLAPSAMVEYKTSWQAGKFNFGIFKLNRRSRNFKLQYALTIPVINTLLRPGYVTISDFVDDNSLTIETDNIKFASFNHIFFVKNRFTAYYILHNNNMLKFNYGLNYFSYYRNYNPVKGFYSSFIVSIVFRFSNN